MYLQSCSINRAFISLNSDDEIRDMPTNYGTTDLPVYAINRTGTIMGLLGRNWLDILDSEILTTLSIATSGDIDKAFGPTQGDGKF